MSEEPIIPQPEVAAPEIGDNQFVSHRPKILVKDRTIFAHPSPVEFEILGRLEDKARLFQQDQVKEKSPTYLVTIDQFKNEATPSALQRALERITDARGNGQNRVAYLYPFLLQEGGKVRLKLALIHPPLVDNMRDAFDFVRQCFDFSKPQIDAIIKSRRNRPVNLPEQNPGAALMVTRKDNKAAFVPRALALENEVKRLIHKAFKDLELSPLATGDFVQRFVQYAKSKNYLYEVINDYHIVIDELRLDDLGHYEQTPELIEHYRAQVDALENQLLPWLKNHAEKHTGGHGQTFVQGASEFAAKFANSVPGRNQRKEKAVALTKLIKTFPHDRVTDENFNKNWQKIHHAFEILEKLDRLKDDLITRRHQKNTENLANRLSTKIRAHSSNPDIRDITEINLREEIRGVNILDDESISHYSHKLFDMLATEFGFWVRPEHKEDLSQVYLVDPCYFLAIEAHMARQAVSSKSYAARLEILYEIEKSIKGHPALADRLNSQISEGQKAEFASTSHRYTSERKEKAKRAEFDSKYNIVQGVLLSLGWLFLFAAIGALNTMWVAGGGLLTLPLLAKLFFKRRQKKEKQSEGSAPQETGGAIDDELGGAEVPAAADLQKEKDEKKKDFYKKVNQVVAGQLIPPRFKTLAHRTFSGSDLAANLDVLIEKLPEFKKFKKEPEKILRNIDVALNLAFVKIRLPENLITGDESPFWYIPLSDFKTSREAIGEGFRQMMNDKPPGSKMHEIYKHLVNCVEMYHLPQYSKFIVKRRG